ncbi:MAG: Gfo/Idh/MocA family oxidoreductase [Clostridia bacterium]|nr:Gfo/Idh/MocA family oxidoreductase [Clostridia bacterium]
MTTFKPVKAAIIGCGMISGIYLENCVRKLKVLDVVGCSDIKPDRSKAKAEQFGIRQMTNEEIWNDPQIELVINITNHTSHHEVSKKSLLAGKHIYGEKMMAVELEEGAELVALAKEKGLYLCGAPDTYLGAGLQTARKIVDAGLIGTPVAANITLVRGYHHERYREDPERRFAFCPGGGIIFDMGCYYLMGLINLLGPVKRVCGFSQIREPDSRRYMNPSNPEYGKVMKIETPNNLAGTIEFECGVLCNILTSSESIGCNHFMLFGTEGQLNLGDPNNFGDAPVLTTKGGSAAMPFTHAFKENSRGIGPADLAYAIRNGREPRCSAERIYHMFEIAHGIMISDKTGEIYTMKSTCTRPEPLAPGCTEYPEMVFDL